MKKLLLCFTLFTFQFSIFTNAQIHEGEFALGGTSSDQANSIVQTKDGGYAVVGYSQSFGPGYYNVYMQKFNSDGKLQWNKIIGGSSLSQGLGIVQSDDGGYAITGYTACFGFSHATVYVIKLDASGNLKWSKTVGAALAASTAEWGYSIIQTNDKGYAIGGYTSSHGAGGNDFYVIKLDSTGALKWTKTIGSSGDEIAYKIIQCSDHGYALAGYTNGSSFSAGNADAYLVKLDSVGNLKWSKSIGGTLGDAGYSVTEATDHGLVLTGYTSSYGDGSDDVYVVKLSYSGGLVWAKTIGGTGTDVGYSIITTKDGGYAIAGWTASFGAGSTDVYLVKTDSSGNYVWSQTYGGTAADYGYSVVQTSDKGYAITGYTDSYGAGSDDFFVIKTDSLGNSCLSAIAGGKSGTGGIMHSGGTASTGGAITTVDSGRVSSPATLIDSLCSTLTAINNIQPSSDKINLYPNPATNTIYIDFGSQFNNNNNPISIQVLDISGRVLLTDNLSLTTDNYPFDITSLSNGMYFLRISSDGGIAEVKKFIKE